MNTAYQQDCLEAMRAMPDNAYSLAVVDPPYGIGVQTMHYTTSGAARSYGRNAAKRRDYRRTDEWDVRPAQEYFDELRRVSKRQIIFGGNYFSDLLPPSHSFLVWDKRCTDAMRNSFADCEYAWCSFGVSRVIRYVWNGMLQGSMKNREERIHPTQKPVALYAEIYRLYAQPGDRILDTHLGSGSSRIAAYDAGLDFTGYEIDKEYFDPQEARFAAHTAQGNLFLGGTTEFLEDRMAGV